MNKTAKEWIASVKDPVIKRYLEKNVSPIVLTETLIESFNAFLYGSFYFGKSKQGELFWHAIGDAVEESDPSALSYSDFKHLDKSAQKESLIKMMEEDEKLGMYDETQLKEDKETESEKRLSQLIKNATFFIEDKNDTTWEVIDPQNCVRIAYKYHDIKSVEQPKVSVNEDAVKPLLDDIL